MNLSVAVLVGQPGACQHREPSVGGTVLSGRRRDPGERRPRAPRLPSPARALAGVAAGGGVPRALTFFSAGTSSPRHLGAFSSLKNS